MGDENESNPGDGDEGGEEGPVDGEADGEADDVPAEALFRWRKEHSVTVDDDFTQALNRDPLVPFFLFRDETSTNDEGEVSGSVSHYHHATILDLSPMLSGHTVVSRTFGGHATAHAWAEEEAALAEDRPANDEASVRSGVSAASRESQRSGVASVTASVASKGGAKQFVESALNQGAKCSYPPPRGIAYLRVTVILANGEPLLS